VSLREDRVEALVKSYLGALIREHEPVDQDERDEYEVCKWRATGFLREHARTYEVMARDESYEDEVRVRAALNARAIREELRP
jgi:hypothetical protein